jgi:hypothetical protein
MKAVPTIAAQKLKMMKASIECLTLGLLGLLPFIGLFFAIGGLLGSYRARKTERQLWNPAKPHRIAGLICASVGALVWSIVDTIVIFHAMNSSSNWNG